MAVWDRPAQRQASFIDVAEKDSVLERLHQAQQ